MIICKKKIIQQSTSILKQLDQTHIWLWLIFQFIVRTSDSTTPLSHVLPALLQMWTVLSFGENASSTKSKKKYQYFSFREGVINPSTIHIGNFHRY